MKNSMYFLALFHRLFLCMVLFLPTLQNISYASEEKLAQNIFSKDVWLYCITPLLTDTKDIINLKNTCQFLHKNLSKSSKVIEYQSELIEKRCGKMSQFSTPKTYCRDLEKCLSLMDKMGMEINPKLKANLQRILPFKYFEGVNTDFLNNAAKKFGISNTQDLNSYVTSLKLAQIDKLLKYGRDSLEFIPLFLLILNFTPFLIAVIFRPNIPDFCKTVYFFPIDYIKNKYGSVSISNLKDLPLEFTFIKDFLITLIYNGSIVFLSIVKTNIHWRHSSILQLEDNFKDEISFKNKYYLLYGIGILLLIGAYLNYNFCLFMIDYTSGNHVHHPLLPQTYTNITENIHSLKNCCRIIGTFYFENCTVPEYSLAWPNKSIFIPFQTKIQEASYLKILILVTCQFPVFLYGIWNLF